MKQKMCNADINTHVIAIMKVSEKKFSPVTNVAIARNFRELGKLNDDVIEERKKLEAEYLEMDENGRIVLTEAGDPIPKEKQSLKTYREKVRELMEDETEVNVQTVPMAKISKEKEATANDLILLDFMIDDSE
ncbi:hypothetical protein [Eubacterium sp.]|uniref:hypothetical protein n=1 Tax=Eubacterium sp. TaxID=142586 RepID=UPI0026DEFCF3|nr:hypothetical protein [Eubacterium sp.]MDO5433318.1 hypothetical protein [Eubacterium sp.]